MKTQKSVLSLSCTQCGADSKRAPGKITGSVKRKEAHYVTVSPVVYLSFP